MDLELRKSPFRNRPFCTRHSRMSSLLNTPMNLKGKEPSSSTEVKVVSRLLWNSRSQEVIGLAMNPEDLSSLHDVYAFLGDEQPQ